MKEKDIKLCRSLCKDLLTDKTEMMTRNIMMNIETDNISSTDRDQDLEKLKDITLIAIIQLTIQVTMYMLQVFQEG